MEYEEEGVFPGSVPELGAIFMSNRATKSECFRRKLLGLPSAEENFVKRVKSGMILFLFEFEKRELYGVYRACSDGAMDIVPHAFSSSGKSFPAQVRFTVIWHCNPLSEHEFRDAIRENYYSNKKFNFGLSEYQVRRLLSLFNLRRSENKVPRRQIGEKILGNEKISIRNKAEKFVEEDSPAHTINTEYHGNSSSGSQRLDNKRIAENSFVHDALTKNEGISLSRRKGASENSMNIMDDKLGFDYDERTGYCRREVNLRDSLYSSRRQSKEYQYSFHDTSETDDIGDAITGLNPRDYLERARGDLNEGRVQMRDSGGDKHISSDDRFPLGKLAERFEIPRTEPRRPIDDQRSFLDREVHYDHNSDADPKPIIYPNRISNSLSKVGRINNDDHIHISDRAEFGGSVDNGTNLIVPDRLPSSMGYAELYQPRPKQSSFNSIKPMFEAHYSLSQNQHKASPPFPRSTGQSMRGTSHPASFAMENKNYEVSYPTSRDSVLIRSIPYDPDFPEVNGTSHIIKDPFRYHSRVRNESSASIKPSYRTECEDLSPQSDRAFRCAIEVPMHDNQDLYDHFDGRIGNHLSSGEYRGNMEQPSITDELYDDALPFSRTSVFARRNISPSTDFNEPVLALQDRVNHKFPASTTDPATCDYQDQTVEYGMRCVQSGSSFDKFNDYDIGSYQDSDGLTTKSRNRITSVFSRLSTSSRKHGQEQEGYMEYDPMDESVDEVMETLFESLGHKNTDANNPSPLGKRHNTEDSTKRREKRFSKIEFEEPTKMTKKMVVECRKDTKQEENEEDVARETRVVEFKRRSDTKKILTGEKRKGFVEPAVDHEIEGSVQKPEGKREEGEMESKQPKRRKLVRPVFGKKEDLNDGSKCDTYSDSQLAGESSSCNKARCVFSGTSPGNPSLRVHKKLVRPVFDTKEESNGDTKRDGVPILLTHESSSCSKVSSDLSVTKLGNTSPSFRVHRKLVRPVFDKKEEPNDSTEKDGVSDLLIHESLNHQKPATSEFLGKTLGNTKLQIVHKGSSCNKASCDLSGRSVGNPSPNSGVQKKFVRPLSDKKEESNDNRKRDEVSDLLNHDSLNNQKPATSAFSAKTPGNPKCQPPSSGSLVLCPSTGFGVLEEVELNF